MTAGKKWLFYFILTLPFFYLVYLALTEHLGAEPAEAINKKLGNDTLILFLINLYWGCFLAMFNLPILRRWIQLRRPLGVATFVYAALHLSSYFLRQGDIGVAFEEMTEKVYLLFGLAAFFVLLALAVTSNNYFVRKLKKRWKQLHRLVFVAFALVTTHVFLIEKKSLLSNKYTIFPMIAVLFLRVLYANGLLRFRVPARRS